MIDQKNKPGLFYGWIVLLSCILVTSSYAFVNNYGVFFSELETSFGWTRTLTSSVISVAYIFYAIGSIIVGKLMDKHSLKAILAIVGAFLGAGLALCSQIQALWQLYLFFGVMVGLGISASTTVAGATVQRWFVKKRGLVLGLQSAGMGIGGLILAPLSGHLIALYGWRPTFIILGIVGFVVMLIASRFIVRTPAEKGLMPYGAEESSQAKRANSAPFPDRKWTMKQALRTKAAWMAWSIHFFASVAFLMIVVHIVPHAKDMGIPTTTAAGALGLIMGFSIAGKILGGHFADKIGFSKIIGISTTLSAFTMLFLIGIRDVWMLYLFVALFGMAYGGKGATIGGMMGQLFGVESLPPLMALLTTARAAGAIVGPMLGGYIFDSTGSYTIAFIIGAACYAITAILAFTVKPPPEKNASPLAS